MAKQKAQPVLPGDITGGSSPDVAADVVVADAVPGAASATDDAPAGVDAESSTASADGSSGDPEGGAEVSQPPPAAADAGAMVWALVLSDGPFGRCGEVREFEAAHAGALEGGGFIDTHPNAVASAEGG